VRYSLLIIILFATQVFAITGNEVINKVDANMTYGSARFETTMVINVRKQVRKKKLVSYAQGRDKSFAKFTYPARDKGVKYLKIKDNMWMYLPSVEKIIKISGHMLRQSMMGSDFSYEDALESDKLREKYKIKLIGKETITVRVKKDGKYLDVQYPCYLLDLTAKVKDVSYYRRKIWVNTKSFVPIKEELFAKSGKKLKVMVMGDIERFGYRYYPMYMSMKNLLRKDSSTEMFVTKAQFNVKLPYGIFTQRNLKK
jgi:outer membrane lipoprotein-sorting protein